MSPLRRKNRSTKYEVRNTIAEPLVWAEISVNNLRYNLRQIRRHLRRPTPEVLAIVKADAYGHGMRVLAPALAKEGIRFFGVANIEEASQLRAVCPKADILVLGSFHKDHVAHYRRLRVRPTIGSTEDLDVLERALKATGRFPVHVKVDTGMGRLGVWHSEAERFFQRLLDSDKITVEGIYTHFASADQPSGRQAREQIYCFKVLKRKVLEMGLSPRFWHAANSLGLARFQDAHLNLVRPGILLYGLNPWTSGRLPMRLRPVLSLKTRISFLKKVPSGRRLSYGGTHQTRRETWIATLPVGYSHGYRVGFSNIGQVLVRGKRCPVVGRVTMDQTLVDVGKAGAVSRWDEVTLIGRQGSDHLSTEELAQWAHTIPYEIVCCIHSRIPRIYKELRGNSRPQ